MAAPGQDRERPAADRQPVVRHEPLEGFRRRYDHAQILQAVAEQDLGALLGQPMRAIEAAIGLRLQRRRVEADVEGEEIFGLAHGERHVETLAEPAGEADVIGVEMGGDEPGELASLQRPVDQRLPGGARGRIVDAGVDQREARAVLDQIEVDVVEPERQREPRPEDARPDLDDLAGLRRLGTREFRVCGGAWVDIGSPCSPSPRMSGERAG